MAEWRKWRDAPDLKSGEVYPREGSTPSLATKGLNGVKPVKSTDGLLPVKQLGLRKNS